MGKKAITRKEKGSILAFTVVILLVALIIALGIAVATIFGMKNAGASGKSTMAFQVADSGVEIFLKRKKAAYEGHGNIKIKDVESPGALECEAGTGYLKGSLENGKKDFFIIMYDGSDNPLDCKINKTDPLDDVFKIKSSGKYSGTVRAVEVRTRDQLLYKLEAWWSFDDPGSGAKAIDLSGNGNEGTISGDVIYDDEGKIGEALTFDGSTNSVDMGNQISLDITGPITLSVWIKPQSLPSGIRQIVNQNSKFALRMKNGIITFADGIPDGNCDTGSLSLTINEWYHVVAVFSGTPGSPVTASNCKIYVNNINETVNASGTWNPSGSVGTTYIGSNNGDDQFFPGLIDEVRIYSRALSETEIKKLANP